MPQIKVIKPFHVPAIGGRPRRLLPAGEHELSQEEHEHWFVQGSLAAGRAKLIRDEQDEFIAAFNASPSAPIAPVTPAKAAPQAQPKAPKAPKDAPKGKGK